MRGLLPIAVCAVFLVGVAWADRAQVNQFECMPPRQNVDLSGCWRLSNYQLREAAFQWSSQLRAYEAGREREMQRQGNPASSAEEIANLKEDYSATYRAQALWLSNELKYRLRPEDRIENQAQLNRIYSAPQSFTDLDSIADNIEWMAEKMPRRSSLLHWAGATFWLWN